MSLQSCYFAHKTIKLSIIVVVVLVAVVDYKAPNYLLKEAFLMNLAAQATLVVTLHNCTTVYLANNVLHLHISQARAHYCTPLFPHHKVAW